MKEKIAAFHIDLKRAMFKMDYLCRYLEHLSRWGYNAVVLEIEDKFRFSAHPELAHPEAPDHDQYREFSAKAGAMGIGVIPMMQSLGHLENIARREAYAHLREAPDLKEHLDASNPASRELVIDLFDEIIEVFQPAGFFHMGGDETWSLGKSEKLRSFVGTHGKGRLYIEHMLPIMQHLLKKKLRPMIWADMLLTYQEIIPEVPKEVVMVDWDYSVTAKRRKTILVWGGGDTANGGWPNIMLSYDQLQSYTNAERKAFVEKHAVDSETPKDHAFPSFWCSDYLKGMGFDVVTAPATRSHGDTIGIPENSNKHLPNCHYFAQKGMRDGLGVLVTSWAVRYNHPEVNLCGAFTAAHCGVDGEFDIARTCLDYTKDVFGIELPEFKQAMEQAQAVTPLAHAVVIEHGITAIRAGTYDLEEARDKIIGKYPDEKAAASGLRGAIAGYNAARESFNAMRMKAKRNPEQLDFWIEGVTMNAICAKFALCIVERTLEEETENLSEECRRARNDTESLFAHTYMPLSVKREADLRYWFFGKLLGK